MYRFTIVIAVFKKVVSVTYPYGIMSVNYLPSCSLIQFDRELQTKWDAAMAAGRFKYQIDELKSRVVPGKQNYLLQVLLVL